MGPKQTLKSSVFTLRALLNRCSLVCLCPSMENVYLGQRSHIRPGQWQESGSR